MSLPKEPLNVFGPCRSRVDTALISIYKAISATIIAFAVYAVLGVYGIAFAVFAVIMLLWGEDVLLPWMFFLGLVGSVLSLLM
jgi:hypothetical protein